MNHSTFSNSIVSNFFNKNNYAMFGIFNKKSDKEIINLLSKNCSLNDTHLIEWFDLSNDQKGELILYNSVYVWYYIIDNNLLKEQNSDIVNLYFAICLVNIEKYSKRISPEFFFELFENRFQIQRNELKLYRENQNKERLYFPSVFYSRLFFQPLTNDSITSVRIFSEEWSEEDLSDMYAHHINYLHNLCEKTL